MVDESWWHSRHSRHDGILAEETAYSGSFGRLLQFSSAGPAFHPRSLRLNRSKFLEIPENLP